MDGSAERSPPPATTTTIVAGELPAGTVAAQRTTIIGKCRGETWCGSRANWYCTPDVEPAWDLRPTGWRVRVRGDAPMDVDIAFPVPLDELGAMTPALTANRPVNADPVRVRGAPGILTTTDLPPMTPAGPPRHRDEGALPRAKSGRPSVTVLLSTRFDAG